MRSDKHPTYYAAYEDRYRSVYGQGVRYWTANPEELAEIKREIDSFLEEFRLRPGEARGAAPPGPADHEWWTYRAALFAPDVLLKVRASICSRFRDSRGLTSSPAARSAGT
jgi:hypothetical protein